MKKRKHILISLIMLIAFGAYTEAHAGLILGAPKYAGLSQGLVGYWKLDAIDINWTTNRTYDRSGFGNDGLLVGMSTTSSSVKGNVGQTLNFNGSGYLNMGSTAKLTNLAPITVTAWIKPTSCSGRIVNKAYGAEVSVDTGFDFYLTYNVISNSCALGFSRGYSLQVLSHGSADGAAPVNQWSFVAVTWDGGTASSSVKLYSNGSETAYSGGNSASGANTDDTSFSLGVWGLIRTGGANPAGLIDDIRIYNRALSPNEIKRLYNVSVSANLETGVSKSNDTLANGLVGWWAFDGPDMEFKANRAYDRSGQNNYGTLTNMSTTSSPAKGKLGQALSFDGVNDYVFGSTLSLSSNFSVSAWIKRTGTPTDGNFMMWLSNGLGGNSGWSTYVHNNAGTVQHRFVKDGNVVVSTSVSNSLDTWEHIVWVVNGVNPILYKNGVLAADTGNAIAINSPSGSLNIGRYTLANSYWQGQVDDVRIYNRVLTADEIKRLYKIGATLKMGVSKANDTLANGLVGWWTFDGKDIYGTTAINNSVSTTTANAALTNGPAPAKGKIGQGLAFDGINDSADVCANCSLLTDTFDLSGPMSLSAWFRLTGSNSEYAVVARKSNGGNTGYGIYFTNDVIVGSVDSISFFVEGKDINNAHKAFDYTADTSWHHVAGVYDGANVKIYLDGIKGTDDAYSGAISGDQQVLSIGGGTGNFGSAILGVVDDVRIWNRALTADEVKRLYNMGR